MLHVQSKNMVKVRTAITRMQMCHKVHGPKCFPYHERWMQKMYICQWVLFNNE